MSFDSETESFKGEEDSYIRQNFQELQNILMSNSQHPYFFPPQDQQNNMPSSPLGPQTNSIQVHNGQTLSTFMQRSPSLSPGMDLL